MSTEGNNINISIPDNVDVKVTGQQVTVKGPDGELTKLFSAKGLKINVENKNVILECSSKAIMGTVKSILYNMLKGVVQPYQRKLIIRYHHFPITVEIKGNEIIIKNYLGRRCPVKCKIQGDVKVEVKKQYIFISGCDKQAVGQTAHNIKNSTKTKLDNRVFQDGIYDAME